MLQEHEAIRVLALLAVLEQDNEYWLRFIRRWYSHHFHTPLVAVEDIPMAFVLQNFYEAFYERQDEDKLEAERQDLAKTAEERWQDVMKQAVAKAEDADFQRFAEAQAEAERVLREAKAKALGKTIPGKVPAKAEVPNPFNNRAPVAEAKLPDVQVPETDVKLTFVSPEALEDEIRRLEGES